MSVRRVRALTVSPCTRSSWVGRWSWRSSTTGPSPCWTGSSGRTWRPSPWPFCPPYRRNGSLIPRPWTGPGPRTARFDARRACRLPFSGGNGQTPARGRCSCRTRGRATSAAWTPRNCCPTTPWPASGCSCRSSPSLQFHRTAACRVFGDTRIDMSPPKRRPCPSHVSRITYPRDKGEKLT